MSLIRTIFCVILVVVAKSSIIPMTVGWNDDTVTLYNDIAIDLVGFLPLGDVISTAMDLLYPEASSQDYLYEQIKKMIDQKILENDMEHLRSYLDHINDDMLQYKDRLDAGELDRAEDELHSAIEWCEQLQDEIMESSHYLQLFPIMVPLSTLHLTALYERYNFHKELNLLTESPDHKDINASYVYYKNWFDSNYPEWYKWRNDRIKTLCTSNCVQEKSGKVRCSYRWSVEDEETKKTVQDGPSDESCDKKKEWMDGTKMAMMNELQNYQIHLISSTFYLHQFVPWLANDPLYFDTASNRTLAIITDSIPKTVSFGPYTVIPSTHRYLAGYWASKVKHDKPGIITKIAGRHGAIIDAIKLTYETHDGEQGTDGHGGEDGPYTIKVNSRWISSFYMSFGRGTVSTMEIGFKDGKVEKVKGEYDDTHINCTMPDNDWRLTSIAQIGGKVSGRSYDGVKSLSLYFTHRDYVSTEIMYQL